MISSKYRKRLAVLVVIILLLLGGVLGVTIAYFQDHTGVIKNTFAPGILLEDFTLVEQKVTVVEDVGASTKYVLTSGTQTGYEYQVLPGVEIPKRPYLNISKLAMDAYLYVVIDTKGAFKIKANTNDMTWVSSSDEKISWSVHSNWKYLTTQDNKAIYYYVGKNDNGRLSPGTYEEIDIMKQSAGGMSITVASDYNYKDDPYNTKGNAVKFNIDFKAYICQFTGAGVADAWTNNFAAQIATDFQ